MGRPIHSTLVPFILQPMERIDLSSEWPAPSERFRTYTYTPQLSFFLLGGCAVMAFSEFKYFSSNITTFSSIVIIRYELGKREEG